LDKIHPKMLQRDGVVMVEMKVLVMVMVMVMMMIPMKSDAMAMTMATISPLWEGIFPTDSYLLESFSLSVFSAPQRRRSLSLIPLDLGFRGRQYTRGGDGWSGLGWPHPMVARPGVGPRHLVVWPPAAPFAFSFWLLPSSGKI
jgi:hypothetical protein